MILRIIRINELCSILSLSRVSIWRLERDGVLPKRKKITDSGSVSGWLESDIKEWLESRPDGEVYKGEQAEE